LASPLPPDLVVTFPTFQVFDVPRNISIPPTAVNNGNGLFSTQLPFAEGKQFVIVMSDAQGFGTGGVSDVLTVGASQGQKCGTASPSKCRIMIKTWSHLLILLEPSFTYQFDSTLQQCRFVKPQSSFFGVKFSVLLAL